MKKLFIAILLVIILSGCSAVDMALDITDIFIEPTPIHYAEVQSITKGKDKTTLFFVDGYNYEITNFPHVNPGDKVKIFKGDGGNFTAEVE